MLNNATVGALFKREIRERGMTIRAVSEKTGIPYSHLQTSLKGTREMRADEFLKLCVQLEINPMTVITETVKEVPA